MILFFFANFAVDGEHSLVKTNVYYTRLAEPIQNWPPGASSRLRPLPKWAPPQVNNNSNDTINNTNINSNHRLLIAIVLNSNDGNTYMSSTSVPNNNNQNKNIIII